MKTIFQFLFVFLCVLANANSLIAQWVQTRRLNAGCVRSLAASGKNLFAGTDSGGVFLSTNNGTSWTAIGLTNTPINALVISGKNLFAGTDSLGAFLSANNGTSWTATGLTHSILAFAVSGTNLFAATDSGRLFLSTNNGTSWTEADSGLTNTPIYALAVSGKNLFAGTDSLGVFLSTDNGTSWTAVNTGLNFFDRYVYALAVSSTNLFVGTLTEGVLLSTNNGTSWTHVNTGLTSKEVTAFAASESNLFAGTVGGGVLLRTNNDTSWTQLNTGLRRRDVWSLAISGKNLFAGTDSGGVFRCALNSIEAAKTVEQYITKDFDRFQKITWYETTRNCDKQVGSYTTFIVEFYLGVTESGKKLFRLRSKYLDEQSDYHDAQWIFYEAVKLLGDDGTQLVVKTDYPQKQTDNGSYGVKEWSDNPVDKETVLKLANCKRVDVRFQGKYTYDFQMTPDQLNALKEIVEQSRRKSLNAKIQSTNQ